MTRKKLSKIRNFCYKPNMSSAYEILSNLITPDNWSFCHFKLGDKKCQITFGATPGKENLDYYVSILDKEDRDLYQKEFLSIETACAFINNNYHDWEFINELNKSSDGCSSCSAH